MIIIGKNTIKTHTHTEVFCILYIYFVINCCCCCRCIFVNFPPLFACRLCWLHRTRSLLPRNCDGIGDRPRAKKTYNGTNGSRNWIFTAFPVVCQSHSLALASLHSPICSHFSSVSLSLSVNDRASDPYKILNKHTSFLYAHIYVYRDYIRPDTSHIFVKNTYDKRQHRQWEYLAKGWGLGVGGTLGTLCESHNRFAFHWQIFLSTVFFSCFEKIHKNTFACRIKKEQQ